MSPKLSIGDNVEFAIHRSIKGKVKFSGLIHGISTSEVANLIPGSDILHNHTNIWPGVPTDIQEENSDSYNSYSYVFIREKSGEMFVIGMPWIRQDTIVHL